MITPQDIRERAAKAHVTMDVVFKKAGVSPSTVWRWERGLFKPRLLTQQKISDALASLEKAFKP